MDAGAHRLKCLHEQRGCRDAVGVEIAVHDDKLTRADRLPDTLHCFRNPDQMERIIESDAGSQEGIHIVGIGYAAVVEDLSQKAINVRKALELLAWG
jgi:hypothetical protein